jgi:hypothetical protein
MGPISWNVTLHKVGEVCQGTTLQLIGPIHNLQRIQSVLNMVLDFYTVGKILYNVFTQ